MLVRFGNANMGIIITVGIIFEALGLGGFWLIIRNEYRAGEDQEDRENREDNPLAKIREKLFHSKKDTPEE